MTLPTLDQLLDVLADRIAARIAPPDEPRYYSAEDNPFGSRRAFLDAARRRAFPSFRLGKRVLARRADVDAWVERPAPSKSSDLDLLRRAGLRPVEGGRR